MPSVLSEAGRAMIPASLACIGALAGCAAPTGLLPRSPACTFAVLVAPTVGCESAPLADQALDDEAKRFATVPGRVRIYVVRDSFVGSRYRWEVRIDNMPVAVLPLDTYVMQETTPGPHRITIVTAESEHSMDVTPEDGTSLFLEAIPTIGRVAARAQLRMLDVERGQQMVRGARRVTGPPFLSRPVPPRPDLPVG
jgi:hypothetical protein